MRTSPLIRALFGALAAACFLAGPAAAATPCKATYSYAGVEAGARGHGVSAEISAVSAPNVRKGHVAGWVGVGGPGYGPGGSSEWIQVGIAAFPGSLASVYYEVRQPQWAAQYRQVIPVVAPGERHRLAVLEVHGNPNAWRVWVDGKAVSPPYYLAGSHAGWKPEATAESWNDGGGVCNGFSFRFDSVAVARTPGGNWQQLTNGFQFEDPGYSMVRRAAASFVASALN